jgi:xanthine dehydrogenase accessory factor
MQNILTCAHNWLSDGSQIILAVVGKTWGSAPRPVGSIMAIHADGHFEGSVSGGCVEGEVIAQATALAGSAAHKTLTYTVSSEDAWQIGLACGGQIQIQLFALGPESAPALADAITALNTRKRGCLSLNFSPCCASFSYSEHLANPMPTAITEAGDQLHLAVLPKPALIIVGAVHISQALVPMAIACSYQVTVIDPRGLFLDKRHFGEAYIISDWPDTYLEQHPLDPCSALVTLTHDPKIDDAALRCALTSEAFYIGSLGSKKTHAARLERLQNSGFEHKNLHRIHGPIGLNIGAKSPAEIAVAIMAELTSTRRVGNEI